jgi:hypothetical protein
MGGAWSRGAGHFRRYHCIVPVKAECPRAGGDGLGGTVSDLLYVGLTIVVFAALWLLVKGVERFER